MTVSPAVLVSGYQLTNAASTIYTCPAATIVVAKRVVFENTDTAAHTVIVYLVRSGQSIGTGTKVMSSQSISAGQAYVANELINTVFQAGDTLQGVADTTLVVNVFMDGFTTGSSGT